MKNKREHGFTLIELLVTVAIVAVIASVTFVVVSNVLSDAEKNSVLANEKGVLSAGGVFVNEFENEIAWRSNEGETMACIPVERLIEKGLIKQSEVGNDYKDYSLKVIKDELEVCDCVLVKNENCRIKDTKKPVITLSNVTVEIKSSYDLKTDVVFDGTGSDIISEKITLNGKNINNTSSLDLGEYQISYVIEDEGGNTASATRKVTIVDRGVPKINLFDENPDTSSSVWVSGNVRLTGEATDNGSGIIAYQFSNNATPGNSSWVSFSKASTSVTQTKDVNAGGKWYFHVKDRSGNVATEEIQLYVDNAVPVFVSMEGELKIQSGNTTLTVPVATFEDSGSGIKEVKYYVTTATTAPSNTNTSFVSYNKVSSSVTCNNQYTAYAVAVDNVGNVSAVKELGKYYHSCVSNPSGGNPSGIAAVCPSGDYLSCMQHYSNMWHNCVGDSCKNNLHNINLQLCAIYSPCTGYNPDGTYNCGSVLCYK